MDTYGGIGQHWTQDAKTAANFGDVSEARFKPNAKVLDLWGNGDGNIAARQELSRIVGERIDNWNIFDGDWPEGWMRKVKDAGYDAVHTGNIEGPETYVLNPDAISVVSGKAKPRVRSGPPAAKTSAKGLADPKLMSDENLGYAFAREPADNASASEKRWYEGVRQEIDSRKAASSPKPATLKVTERGELQIPGKATFTPEQSADVTRLLREPDNHGSLQNEWGSKRYARAVDALGDLEEAGGLDAAPKLHEEWLTRQQQAEAGRGVRQAGAAARETGQDPRALIGEAHSQGLAIEHQAEGKTYRYRQMPDSVTPAQRQSIYDTLATPGRLHTRGGKERVYHTPQGSGSLHDVVVGMGLLPEDAVKVTAKAPKAEVVTPTAPVRPEGYGKSNKIFTEERANAARERVLKKFGRTNALLDPELLRDGIEIAGYHIEAGARSFANYSKAMVEDFGEGVKPHLRQWYEAVRHQPDFDAKGMSHAAEIEAHLKGETPVAKPVKAEIQPQPRETTGLANQVLEREVKAGTLKQMPKQGRANGWIDEQQALKQGADAIDQGRIDPQRLADEINAKPRPVSAEEMGAFTVEAARLKQEADTFRQIHEREPSAKSQADYDAAQDAFQAFIDKVQKSKTQISASLNAIKAGIHIDTKSYADVIERARKEAGAESVRGLKKGVTEEFAALTSQMRDLEKEIAAKEAAHAEAIARHEVELAAARAETSTRTEGETTRTPRSAEGTRQAKKARLQTELKQHLSDLATLAGEALKEGGGGRVFSVEGVPGAAAGVAYHLIKKGGAQLAWKVAVNIAEQTGLGFDEVIDRTIKAFASKGVTVRAEDITAEFMEVSEANRKPGAGAALKTAAAKLKKDARDFENLLAEKARIERGEKKATPARKAAVEGRISQLRKEIREMKIASGERKRPTPPKRKPVPEAERLAALRAKIAAMKRGEYPPGKPKAAVSADLAAAQKEYRALAAKNPTRKMVGATGNASGSARSGSGKAVRARKGRQPLTDQQLIDRANARAAEYLAQLESGALVPPKQARQLSDEVKKAQAMRDFLHRRILSRIKQQRPKTTGQKVVGGLNLIRGTLLGGDVGTVMRQGLFGTLNPTQWAATGRSLKAAGKAFLSEENMALWEHELNTREIGGKRVLAERVRAGLQITDTLSNEEETVVGRALKKIPGVGGVGERLERFQVTFINNLRAEMFDQGLRAGLSGDELKLRAAFINNVTGRSNLKQVDATWSAMLTSPRYEASRWATLAEPFRNTGALVADAKRGRLNKAALLNLKDMIGTAGGLFVLYKGLELAGYQVNTDPTHTDFLKARKGNDVKDFSAGMAPRLRDLMRVYAVLSSPDPTKKNLQDLAGPALMRVINPGVSVPVEQGSMAYQKHVRHVAQPKSPISGYKAEDQKQGLAAALPLLIQSAREAYKQEGWGAAVSAAGTEFIGGSSNRYPKPGKWGEQKQDSRGAGRSGGRGAER
jgi:hypothetical protein